MILDQTFIASNRSSTDRLRALAARLTDDELRRPVGQHWTVAITLAHLAFWDRRVLAVLDATEQEGKLSAPFVDFSVNDLLLPFWAAMSPRQAALLAVETAQALDKRLADFPEALLAEMYAAGPRWVDRSLHRNAHLDEIEAAG